MEENLSTNSNSLIKAAPKGLAMLVMVGPAFVWCAEYIGSGEVILATRTGAILGSAVLWAVVWGIFLKYWIGLCGARYTVCTGEGMIDMFDRMPGPKHWAVWIVLLVQFMAGTFSIGAMAASAGVFLSNLTGLSSYMCGWGVTIFAVAIAWSGVFNILKFVMSGFVLVTVIGVIYVAARVYGDADVSLNVLGFTLPQVPEWASAIDGVSDNPWKELLPLLGWGAGGFASQVWYSYWVIGAGYGAAHKKEYGKKADAEMLKNMTTATAEKIKGWCHVVYLDSTFALVIGVVVTAAFLICGAGILNPAHLAPSGDSVALTLSKVFSHQWGKVGAFLFMLSGTAALISTLIGLLAGWPRLLADAFRICIPAFGKKLAWKTQFRGFLIYFIITNMIIVFHFQANPVAIVKFSAIFDGLLLTPLQAIWILTALFFILPKMLSKEAYQILKPSKIFAVGLIAAFLVFGYFCVVQVPAILFK